jgi:hypothetical protein
MMNSILDNESCPVEERLEMAKIMLELKDKQIQRLKDQVDKEISTRKWIQDQSGNHRMGL